LLKNFPVDEDLPGTPKDGRPADGKKTFLSEACLLGLAQVIGEPIGYRLEKEGTLVHNLCPVPGSAFSQSNESSQAYLRFHNDLVYDADNPHIPYNVNNPDFFLLSCLRQDKNREAETVFIDARDICARLTQAEIEVLRQPQFSISIPYSFRKGTGVPNMWSVPIPVIAGPTRYPEITLDFGSGMKALVNEYAFLFEKLEMICNDPEIARSVALEPGQIVLIHNRKGVHGRTSFRPTFDGNDRWLQRVYVRRSMWELRNKDGKFSRIF
jgi:L-asparagine oxygenase